MESLKELYRIGPGPSSSHTIGVQNACLYYLSQYPDYPQYKVVLTGSLALTGKGHMSDVIIKRVMQEDRVRVEFNYQIEGKHPNTMIFSCLNGTKEEHIQTIYSIGGGAIAVEGKENLVDENVYPHQNLKQIMDFCQKAGFALPEYVYHYEPEIKPFLIQVAKQMMITVHEGLQKTGELPGELKIKKVAKELYQKAQAVTDSATKERLIVSCFAYAAMEQNATGQTVVTAPTLGSCGIMSALVNYYHFKGIGVEKLADGLAVAGIFGNVVKTNATISGAAGGCQAEVGTACAMGAAFASYMENLNNRQIEYAAEIAMEHHLGLTCDPVGGYVQVPCIERNGVGVLRSLDSMMYAKYLSEIKENKVTFDMIVDTMKHTGNMIPMELRETSLGGLAEIVPLNNKKANC